MESSLIFIGEKKREQEWQITRKPDFYDAILLSHQSPQIPKAVKNGYQRLPLHSANFTFNLCDHNIIHFTYKDEKLTIEKEAADISMEEVFNIFNSLLLKEGNRISYLVQKPKGKTVQVKREKIKIIAESKKLINPDPYAE